jgi:D-alanyl-D-alanine carboxypeptidase
MQDIAGACAMRTGVRFSSLGITRGVNCAVLFCACMRTVLFTSFLLLATPSFLEAQLSADLKAKIDAAAQKVLADTGVPSAEVGIVQNGRIVYRAAFGQARLKPEVNATPEIAYPVGSISKQFTATAVLLLQQDGKLSLNDPVAKFFPELTRAGDITLRNLLTHTSGYQDYAPQDYTIPAWRVPGDPLKVVHEFAGKPLDFEPGTQWQYSNTNFVLAALIVQKVSGMPFAQFMRERVLRPAGLEHVLNLNTDAAQLQVTGYMRNALAPIRPAALEASGWYFGDGDLAMPVASLLTWDLTLINRSLLSSASYDDMEQTFVLKDGKDSHYGLGIFVGKSAHGLKIEHAGEVGGFTAENEIFPEQHVAIAVLTNQEATNASEEIAKALEPLVLAPAPATGMPGTQAFAARLKNILQGLQQGKIDRTLLTADCNSYFQADALHDFQASLAPLGMVTEVKPVSTSLRGGMQFGSWKVTFANGTAVEVTTYVEPDGKIEQLLVTGKA